MKVNNTLTFNGSVTNYENFNDSLFRTKIRVFAFGNNRNGSNFSPESFSTATQKSISLIPIVAKYNEEEDDLEGHNVNLKKNSSGEYEPHFDTYPIGMVSPDSNFTLEEVNEGSEEFPDIKTYVVVDNIYLWKRYEATKKIISWLEEGVSPKVSMEIDGVTGKFSEDGYFQIESFKFSAIAALGSEIEPCFKKAGIEAYSQQDFKTEFSTLVYELNETLKQDGQGGTKMTEETKTQEELDAELEGNKAENKADNKVEETSTEKPEDKAEFTDKDENQTKTKPESTEKPDEVKTEEATDSKEQEETNQEFALTSSQLRQQIEGELRKEHYHDSWGDKCRRYWYVDHTDAVTIAEDCNDGYQLYAVPYTLNGDNVELKLEESYKVKIEYVAFEGESTSFTSNFERIEDEKSSLQSQLEELTSYKRSREEDDIKSQFADKLSDEEMTEVFTAMKEASIEDVEVKLFALYGKKNFTVTKLTQNQTTDKVTFSLPKDSDKNVSPYGTIFDEE